MKRILLLLLIILITSCTTTTKETPNTYLQDTGNIQIYFCPSEECETELVNFINTAKESIHCALFEVHLESLKHTLIEKEKLIDVKIVTDNDYLKKFNQPFVRVDRSGLMHNKFCLIDNKKVSTGSMNPTENGAYKNNNNLLLINSKLIAKIYETEFQEMWNGTFKKGDTTNNNQIILDKSKIKIYFCPEDSCAYRVKEELKKAKESIHFMTFSFTHDGIGNILLLKHLDNITIEGIMEARQVTKHSQFARLIYSGINITKISHKGRMHHKVFIIDNKTVITGSFNPTGGGNTRNDENLLIIKDKDIAEMFMEEFELIKN